MTPWRRDLAWLAAGLLLLLGAFAATWLREGR